MIAFRVALVAVLALAGPAAGQRVKKVRQYKRVHQDAFRLILAGKTDRAIQQLRAFAAKYTIDAETRYMLAVAHSTAGRIEKAANQAAEAVKLGLPPSRLAAGSLTGLQKLRDDERFLPVARQFTHEVAHGPMLGCVTGTSVKVWARAASVAALRAVASESKDMADPVRSPPVRTSADGDFTAIMTLNGLKPTTKYYYRVEVDGRAEGDPLTFTTAVKQGEPLKLRLAFGGGAGFVPEHEKMWNVIRAKSPDVLLLLGDNVYIDDPKSPAMQHYCYYRRQARPEFRALVGRVPVYTIWDDHDFGTNDCRGGPQVNKPSWKPKVWGVYRNNWVNPGYGGGEEHPGCYYDFMIGDIHFIMLDGRYYRSRASMLGPVQKRWLLGRLKSSEGRVKVLCSPVPWVFGAKGDSKDTWNGFRSERKEIFDYLTANKIDGVLLMSADRHRSDLWKIDRPGDYPLYEVNSSKLTNQHTHKTMPAALFSYNKKQSFGLVEIDTTGKPRFTYKVVNIDGDEVHSFTGRIGRE